MPHQKIFLDHINYPLTARKQGLEGKSIIKFMVGKTGSISEISLVNSPNDELNEEAIKVFRQLIETYGHWIPARKNGKATSTVCYLPIQFSLK